MLRHSCVMPQQKLKKRFFFLRRLRKILRYFFTCNFLNLFFINREYNIENITLSYLKKERIPVWKTSDMSNIVRKWWMFHRKTQLEDNIEIKKDIQLYHFFYNGLFIKTNYPYVYHIDKKKKYDFNDMKVIYLPAIHMHSKGSIYEYQKIFKDDEKMPFLALLDLLKINENCSKSVYRFILKMKMYLKKKNLILYMKYLNEEIIKYKDCENFLYIIFEKNYGFLYKILLLFIKDAFDFDKKKKFKIHSLQTVINNYANKNIKEIKNLTTIKMKNDSIVKQIQGRDSTMRRQLLSPKIMTLRSQINLRFDLQSNEVIMPISMINELNIYINLSKCLDNLYDLENPMYQKECFIDLSVEIFCMMKRDPVLCKNSIILISRIAFAKTDLFFIGPYNIIGQNADFDGDAENCCILQNLTSGLEGRLYLASEYNIYLGYLKLKLIFTETHILYMHQRGLPKFHKFKKRFDNILSISFLKWFSNQENIDAVFSFKKQYPNVEIFKYIEPTRIALELLMLSIYVDYGSQETFSFFNEINLNIVKLSNNENCDFKVSHLPNQYIIENAFLDLTLLKIVLSGATGSLDHYLQILNTVNEKKEMTNVDIYQASTLALSNIGIAARNVPTNGHESFKTIIEFNGFVFCKDEILYKDKCILKKNVQEIFFHYINVSEELLYLRTKNMLT
ncbi:hypothetical protein LbFV_ORF78 [Leptopilina boulardi filamentous virus]|uniref:Uncharacterized protein n=1 Tax=Leptopilina boulardi filamentous virus TaxID=552509 RepID=A0A1S5YDB6_9VIRU|nr:hypothetical protein LbFV_ORF78 [Leptopilina boulardi filamentous virus]AQQ79998.1 hypothetical protein LbFV_ORF78 [Leptopilina boulardi filamentous virus]